MARLKIQYWRCALADITKRILTLLRYVLSLTASFSLNESSLHVLSFHRIIWIVLLFRQCLAYNYISHDYQQEINIKHITILIYSALWSTYTTLGNNLEDLNNQISWQCNVVWICCVRTVDLILLLGIQGTTKIAIWPLNLI